MQLKRMIELIGAYTENPRTETGMLYVNCYICTVFHRVR